MSADSDKLRALVDAAGARARAPQPPPRRQPPPLPTIPLPGSPGYAPVGSTTGAPPPVLIGSVRVAAGGDPTRVVGPTRENRRVSLLAPVVGFTIFLGGAGVRVGNGFALVGGLEHFLELVGEGELWAVTNSPVPLPLQVQVATLLIGDRERVVAREGR